MSADTLSTDFARLLAESTGAKTTETFADTEARATEMATGNQCLVPEMSNELYDCCGSQTVEMTCYAFGSLNAIILASIVISWFILISRNEWFRS